MTDEKKKEKKEEKELMPRDYWMYDPWPEVRRMLDNVRSNIDDMFQRVPRPSWRPPSLELPRFREPYADVIDTGTELKVVADLPGVEKEDIDIRVTPDSIEISAESKIEKEETTEARYVYKERRYTSFKRMLTLPAEVVPEQAQATLNKGVLEVVIPKKEPTTTEKKVKIDVK